MIRLVIVLLLALLVWRWALGNWPWDYLRGPSPREKEMRRARILLGVRADDNARQIRDAHRKMAGTIHPDRGGSNARLAEINAARDLLLSELPNQQTDEHP
ncbi:MAG: molecular chaperone DnaJ [Qipengyuania sp.]